MNQAVLKWATLGTIGVAVTGALWLATSVQVSYQPAPAYRSAQATSTTPTLPALTLVALPAERAASSALRTLR